MYFCRKEKPPPTVTCPILEGLRGRALAKMASPASWLHSALEQPGRLQLSSAPSMDTRVYTCPWPPPPIPASQPGPSSFLEFPSLPTSFPGVPTMAAQVQMPLESRSSQQVGDPVSAFLCISSACLAPKSPAGHRRAPQRGWGRALVSPLGSPSLLSQGVRQPGEDMQFPLQPLGAARQLWLVPPLPGPPTWQVLTFT